MSIQAMLDAGADQLLKGNAIVTYAEALTTIDRHMENGEEHQALAALTSARERVETARDLLGDSELDEIAGLLELYEDTIRAYVS